MPSSRRFRTERRSSFRKGAPLLRHAGARRAFTLVEILVVTALLALLAAVILPRFAFGVSDPQTALQRALWAAVDLASGGTPLRLRMVDGALVAEVRLPRSPDVPLGVEDEERWGPVPLNADLPGKGWIAAEPCAVGADGAVSPWTVVGPENAGFAVAVTGRVYPQKLPPKN